MDFIHFICWEDELKWLGQVPRLGFVTSEEELLFGQVSLALLGLSNALSVIFLRKGRSSDELEFELAHYFWAGPHNSIFSNKFLVFKNKRYPNRSLMLPLLGHCKHDK